VPTTRPISILKKPSADAIKEAGVKMLLPEVVVHGPALYEADAKTGFYRLLDENDVTRFYPKEHAAEEIMRRLRSMVRRGRRLAAARRARQRSEALTAANFSPDLLVSRPGAHTSTSTPT
jgi:hypothetical protein